MVGLLWIMAFLFWAAWLVQGTLLVFLVPLVAARYRDAARDHRPLWPERRDGAPKEVRRAAVLCFVTAILGALLEPVIWPLWLGPKVGAIGALGCAGMAVALHHLGFELLRNAPCRARRARGIVAACVALHAALAVTIWLSPEPLPALGFLIPAAFYRWIATVMPAVALITAGAVARALAVSSGERTAPDLHAGAEAIDRERRERIAMLELGVVGIVMAGFGVALHGAEVVAWMSEGAGR